MTSLKEWNAKPLVDRTFGDFTIFMRDQYLKLQAVSGLAAQNSSLNIAQEKKSREAVKCS